MWAPGREGSFRVDSRWTRVGITLYACDSWAWRAARADARIRGRLGDVAQLGEHRLCKPRVEGSSPFVSTKETAGQRLTRALWPFPFLGCL